MSVKLVAAAVVLVVGVALASLFPRTGERDPGDVSPTGVALRKAPATQPRLKEPRDRLNLPPLEATVAPAASEQGSDNVASTHSSTGAAALRHPPPMPADYRALAQKKENATVPNEPRRLAKAHRQMPADPPRSSVVHRVVDGDTLSGLADRYLGDPTLANHIWQANRARLPQNPELLPIGVELHIPLRVAEAAKKPLSNASPADGALTRLVPVQPAPVVADTQGR